MIINKKKVLGVFLIAIILSGCQWKQSEDENTATLDEKIESSAESEVLIIEESENDSANTKATTIEETEVEIDELEELVQEKIESMTLEEKVAQMFIITPESLMPEVGTVVAAGEITEAALNEIPVGGFIYMSSNLENEEQVQSMLSNTNTYSMNRIGLPAFLSVDEEGGTVTRISGRGLFDVPTIPNMSELGGSNDLELVEEYGEMMGIYLSDLGFNLDYAPVADVLTNSENTVVEYRSFSSDPEVVIEMDAAIAEGLESNGVLATYKHFPGHGSTSDDSHDGYAYTDKTIEELWYCELVPFQAAIDAGCSFLMVGHIAAPNITGDDIPASLSKGMISELLRSAMHYDGIVITDAMNMGAITEEYTSAEASILAIQAGVDIVLMPEDFMSAYEGVIEAVENGIITEERIDESLTRILKVKYEKL